MFDITLSGIFYYYKVRNQKILLTFILKYGRFRLPVSANIDKIDEDRFEPK